jgi:subtilisin family serine protease
LGSIGDPGGQLFVVQSLGLLNSVQFLTRLLSATGIVDAEVDQTVNTLGATVGVIPSYLTDEKSVSYYGAQVWEGYLVQTPNEIVRTAQTQATFKVSGRGVIVALIDTGVDTNNTILAPHLVSGYDFTRNTNGGSESGDINQSTAGVIDGSMQVAQLNQSTAGVIYQGNAQVINQPQYSAFGHGTMTAGIVHLVAPSAGLMPLKAFNANGTGYASDVLRAVYYAVNHNAKVVSMSFEFTSPSVELAKAINYATGRSVICVASAGNDASMTIVYPAGLPNVIDVASTSNTNTPSAFSNYGTPPVWISAPGEAVMTTYPFNTYAVGWGTSFSAPFVSGTVALMASLNSWSSYSLNQTSAAKALSRAQAIPESQYGFGVLDTYRAVQAWKNSSSFSLF